MCKDSREEEGKPHNTEYKAREETTHTFARHVPLEERPSRVPELLTRTAGPRRRHTQWTQRKAEMPKCCMRVPKGSQARRLLATIPPCAILSTMTSLLFVLKQHRWAAPTPVTTGR